MDASIDHTHMRCPACTATMEEKTVDGIIVEQCPHCGGLWFDALEMPKFDESHESGEELLQAESSPPPADAPPRTCPRCADVTMLQHHSSVRRALELDECGNCGGFFLDGGELARYRDEFATQHARDAAAQEEFSKTIDDALGDMRADTAEESLRIRRIVHSVRWICPSWYVPGKQSWGAF